MTGIALAIAGASAQNGGGSGMTVVAVPAFASSPSSVSPSVTATPTGGTSPYTYNWAMKSGSPLINIDEKTAATTTFSTTSDLFSIVGQAVCNVTDDDGNSAVSNTVTIHLNRAF